MYRVVFDLFQPNIEDSVFASGTTELKDFYGEIDQELTLGMPKPLGKSATTTCFIDAKHTGNIVTLIFYTCVFIYIINMPITWF